MVIIEVKDLCKSYGKGEVKVEALKNINLTIEEGEFVAIVGASGSGKSTLLHLLGGMDNPNFRKDYFKRTGSLCVKGKGIIYFKKKKIWICISIF